MSIWGKLVGGVGGFALGGPLGALLGLAAGQAVDWVADSGRRDASGDQTRTIAFTIGVVVLSAKMAKADGAVTDDEVAAFWRIVDVPDHERQNVARVFRIANRDAHGFQPYARQLGDMFRDRPEVLEELLGCLMIIARADGVIAESEIQYLRAVAQLFGMTDATFARIRAAELGPDRSDPYVILGVSPDATDEEVKAAHRRLLREHHPDRLIAAGMPQEFIDVATQRMASINAAYDRVRDQRGIR